VIEIKLKAEHSGDDDIVRDIMEPVTKETGSTIGQVVVTNSTNQKKPSS